jgi:hypothetical protein
MGEPAASSGDIRRGAEGVSASVDQLVEAPETDNRVRVNAVAAPQLGQE